MMQACAFCMQLSISPARSKTPHREHLLLARQSEPQLKKVLDVLPQQAFNSVAVTAIAGNLPGLAGLPFELSLSTKASAHLAQRLAWSRLAGHMGYSPCLAVQMERFDLETAFPEDQAALPACHQPEIQPQGMILDQVRTNYMKLTHEPRQARSLRWL